MDVTTTVTDVEHNHTAPGDSPLLGTDQPTTFAWRRKFGDINWNLC
jgi:hypothetical protein